MAWCGRVKGVSGALGSGLAGLNMKGGLTDKFIVSRNQPHPGGILSPASEAPLQMSRHSKIHKIELIGRSTGRDCLMRMGFPFGG